MGRLVDGALDLCDAAGSTARGASPVVVFDFDGTIADSFDEVLALYDVVAAELRLPIPTPAQIAQLRRMSPSEALRSVAIPLWKVPRIVAAVRDGMRDRIHTLDPFPGIHDAIRALHTMGCRCCILSSNSRENVRAFLGRHAMSEFEVVSCGASLLGKGARIRRLVAGAAFGAGPVFYVGDEVRDVLAASEAGVRSVAVSWGYNDRSVLEAAGAEFVLDVPNQIIELFTTLASRT